MINYIFVGIGGAIGAILRYAIGFFPIEHTFPIKTLFINVLGSFIIGIIAALTEKYSINPNIVLLTKVGICGGFTTFSTFSLETFELIQKGNTFMALSYIILSVLFSLGAILIAQKIV